MIMGNKMKKNSQRISTKSCTTDKTDNICNIENNDFLETIFADAHASTKPIVVSFNGHPANANWHGKGWKYGDQRMLASKNNYFSLSCYNPDKFGKFKRQKGQFNALYAIMLDDVGTKSEHKSLTLKPSWLLETSKNNYQAGYILSSPITDADLADNLMKAIISAGLCDAGAGGPTARLARLPKGINGKNKPYFSCNLESWNPDLRYNYDDLVNGFKLDIKTSSSEENKNEVYVPCPENNPVIIALKTKNLYKAELEENKHNITCPWVGNHTDSIDSGTAYFEPNEDYSFGGFNCFHGHCKEKHIDELLDFLSIKPENVNMKPTIYSQAGKLHLIADGAEKALARSKNYYQRGGVIVSIVKEKGTRDISIKHVSQPALTLALAKAVQWMKYSKTKDAWVITDPLARIVTILHDAIDYKHLSFLNGLAYQPYLRDDGSLVTKSDYHEKTGMFGVFDSQNFTIPENPTREDAEKALHLISDLISEFSFAHESDRAAAFSAILTAAIRPSLAHAPMFHVRAPQISSGKSFLCKIISAFSTPQKSAPTSFPHDDEECKKLLLSELMRSPAVIEFDNLTSDLVAYKSLCSVLTEEFMRGRILGVSKTISVNTKALFLSSGNNVGPVKDMLRRCITINLDPECENPATRLYKNPNLLENLFSRREKYVSAALTIIMAWISSGQPHQEVKELNGYKSWTELCRQPLLWLGMPDPVIPLFNNLNDDPERDTLGHLLKEWHRLFENTPKMVRQAVDVAEKIDNEEFREILHDIAGERHEINRRILGHYIKRNANRIVDGLRFIPAGGSRSAAAWHVEKIESVSSDI